MKDVHYLTKYISVRITVACGIPCVRGTRIYCATLAMMHKAGDSIKFLARMYDLKPQQVRAAVNHIRKYKNKKAVPAKHIEKYYKHRPITRINLTPITREK